VGSLNTGSPNTRFFGDPGSRDQKGGRMTVAMLIYAVVMLVIGIVSVVRIFKQG